MVGRASVGRFAKSPAEIGAGGVGQVVIGQFAPGEDGVDEGQAGFRSVTHCHGHGAIQFNYRRWFGAQQQIIQPNDL